MLRIREDIDLKELEKFGFYRKNDNYYKDFNDNCICVQGSQTATDFGFYKEFFIGGEFTFKMLETFYDLIKSDLIEKVEE